MERSCCMRETDVLLKEYAVLKVDEEQYQALINSIFSAERRKLSDISSRRIRKQTLSGKLSKVVVENGTIG